MRPKTGCDEQLRGLVARHVDLMRAEGYATDREPVIVVAADGTVVEVFEWVSAAAIEAAHTNPRVTAMWAEYEAVCDFIPAAQIAEMNELFSEFAPLEDRRAG